VLYRVFRSRDDAPLMARGGPLHVPRGRQGAGRHDSPGHYGAFYAARSAEAAAAEAIAAFRGRELDDADLELADGSRLALAAFDDSALGELTDLDEPAVLLAEGWRPSRVASRDRQVTQAMAVQIFEAGQSGISWWSTLDSAWTNVTLFAERTIDPGMLRLDGSPERLSVRHAVLIAAADHLAITLSARQRRRSPG
jgi:RES domain